MTIITLHDDLLERRNKNSFVDNARVKRYAMRHVRLGERHLPIHTP